LLGLGAKLGFFLGLDLRLILGLALGLGLWLVKRLKLWTYLWFRTRGSSSLRVVVRVREKSRTRGRVC
jgi:hypothetical protein